MAARTRDDAPAIGGGAGEQVRRLAASLTRGLPGVEAQARMAPRPRPGWYPGTLPPGAREGAGLVLLYPRGDDLSLPLTVRPTHLPQHGGQVSLPGGARERDETLTEAALREAREEVGLDPSGVVVLGALTPLHIPVSGFVLHPVLAWREARPPLRACEREVARILEVPVGDLGDPERVVVERRRLADRDYDVPYFAVDGEKVWGATAMILAELLWLLEAPPDPFRSRRSSGG